MSSPLGQPSHSGGFQLPAPSSRGGRDPDGLVDNRPGIAHPSMTRTRAKSAQEAQHAYRDHYARTSNSSSDRINQASETTRDTERQKDLMVGVSLRAPKPLRKVKTKKRRGHPNDTTDEWGDEWSWTGDDCIEMTIDPDAAQK